MFLFRGGEIEMLTALSTLEDLTSNSFLWIFKISSNTTLGQDHTCHLSFPVVENHFEIISVQ
jgi:hypothetical protein